MTFGISLQYIPAVVYPRASVRTEQPVAKKGEVTTATVRLDSKVTFARNLLRPQVLQVQQNVQNYCQYSLFLFSLVGYV